MSKNARSMIRETGAALAVLAIYVLTLLLPLHQAAGLQRDLDRLGYKTLGVWSVCTSLVENQQGDPDTPTAVKCPATGVAKFGFATPPQPSVDFAPALTVATVAYVTTAPPIGIAQPRHFGQSRAPPVLV